MLGLVVFGSRTWMCTIEAPALAASRQELAICSGVTGTAGFLPGVSAEPVTAQEIITLRAMAVLPFDAARQGVSVDFRSCSPPYKPNRQVIARGRGRRPIMPI